MSAPEIRRHRPEADDGDGRSAAPIVLVGEGAAVARGHTERLKIAARYELGGDDFRTAGRAHGDIAPAVRGEISQGSLSRAIVHEIRIGEVVIDAVFPGIQEHDQLVRLRDRQRAEHHRVQQAEHD